MLHHRLYTECMSKLLPPKQSYRIALTFSSLILSPLSFITSVFIIPCIFHCVLVSLYTSYFPTMIPPFHRSSSFSPSPRPRSSKYRPSSEHHNDNFSLSTIAEGSHPNVRKLCDTPPNLPHARALAYYDNIICQVTCFSSFSFLSPSVPSLHGPRA